MTDHSRATVAGLAVPDPTFEWGSAWWSRTSTPAAASPLGGLVAYCLPDGRVLTELWTCEGGGA